MGNQMVNDFKKGLGQLGVETAEKLVEQTGKILDPTITAQELLGNIKPLGDEEMAQKKAEDEKKKQEEMTRLRQGFGGQAGRNVENEMEQLRQQKEKEEEEKGNIELENLKREEKIERQNQMVDFEPILSKHSKNKGGNPHKKQQPDQSQMSQTSEYKGKID